MSDSTIYFATDRLPAGAPEDWRSYGARMEAPTDPKAITYAAAFVTGTDLLAEGSGSIRAIVNPQRGGFAPGVGQDITNSGKNLLVFVHGFANAFEDAIKRAAFNRAWFAASGVPAADTTVLAFSWPSLGQVIAAPPHLLPEDYLKDQGQAGRSGFHLAAFFQAIAPLLRQARSNGRRCFLLAHSMGNYALQAAVESWFNQGHAPEILFDEVFLAAADERDDSFAIPHGGRLSRLRELGSRISIYHSVRDVAMYLSFAVNLRPRLGYEGPANGHDPVRFPPAVYRIIDCAGLNDYDLLHPGDASHQYYRRSPKARADIAAVMAGTVPAPVVAVMASLDAASIAVLATEPAGNS
jgi:esterase/lipase superfamily enzyme